MKKVFLACLVLVGCGQGMQANVKASGGVSTKAEVIVSFPEAARCFDDHRIATYEQLQACLDAVTGYSVTLPEGANDLCKFFGECK